MNEIAIYVAAAMAGLWGVSHVVFTGGVVADFGDLTPDNKRIITMEWITEGVALIAIAAFVSVAAAIDREAAVASGVFAVAIGTLLVLAAVSLFTGFRIAFLPFRLCPFVFSTSAALIALGAWV